MAREIKAVTELVEGSLQTIIPGWLTLSTEEGVVVISTTELSKEVLSQAVLHGLKQKICDAAAIARSPVTGRSATTKEKLESMRTVRDRLVNDGKWNASKGEGASSTGGLLFQALCRHYEGKRTEDEIRAFLAKKSKAEQAALRKLPPIAALIEEIKAEQGADGDGMGEDLLGELED